MSYDYDFDPTFYYHKNLLGLDALVNNNQRQIIHKRIACSAVSIMRLCIELPDLCIIRVFGAGAPVVVLLLLIAVSPAPIIQCFYEFVKSFL